MTGGWPLGQVANLSDQGSNTSGTYGTQVNTPATANSYASSYTTVVSATPYDTGMLGVAARVTASGYVVAFDLAVGASGSEVIVAQYLVVTASSVLLSLYNLRCQIPAGTRISARARSAGTSRGVYVQLQLGDTDWAMPAARGPLVTYGFSTSTSLGTAITGGSAADNKGAWVQLNASPTAVDHGALHLGLEAGSAAAGSTYDGFLDLGVGASGAQQVLISNFWYRNTGSTTNNFANPPGPFPVVVPAGSTLWARSQNNLGSVGPNLTLYGESL